MPLDPHELHSLYLSGTIRIPHAAPATAGIYLVRHAIPGTGITQEFLRVVHDVHDGLRFTYLLRLKDVRAVKLKSAPEEPTTVRSSKRGVEPVKPGKGSAPLGENPPGILLPEHLEELLKKTPPAKGHADELWIADASVFVPEGAPVHVQTQAGLSAAQSAQFQPRMFSLRSAQSPCDTNPHH
jgi:hypothetical protein